MWHIYYSLLIEQLNWNRSSIKWCLVSSRTRGLCRCPSYTWFACCIRHYWSCISALMFTWNGIHDQALVWTSSHLSDKLKRVNIKLTTSDTQELSFGVPQSSVLGPILYYLYTKTVSFDVLVCCIIHRLMTHLLFSKIFNVEDCVSEIKLWMERPTCWSWMMIRLN